MPADQTVFPPAATHNLSIDRERLWDSLMEMARIGPGVGQGNNRQTLTDEDGEARHLLTRWCDALDLTAGVDPAGNMFFRRAGSDPAAKPVVFGSHLDTQPSGGKYDGVLGTLAGLEVMRTLKQLDIETERPVVLVNWTNEEGTRFAPSLLGSGVYAGLHDVDWAYRQTDADGRSFGAELARIGWKGDGRHVPKPEDIHAYFELHIEQGPILEEEGLDIGVVTRGQGSYWLKITLTGRDAHAGTTPMTRRKDAGLGMARIAEAVHAAAMAHQPDAVATVGNCVFRPNSVNVIPGEVIFTVDLRSPEQAILDRMKTHIEAAVGCVSGELGLEAAIEVTGYNEPVDFDAAQVARVRDAAAMLGYKHKDMVSGAGHDAFHMARIAPSAMIFCPCVGGLSHNEDEEITPDWAAAGTNVLLRAVLDAAGVVDSTT